MTTPELAPREGDRIAKLLARAGIASRREVERMIADGRVKLDGEVLTTPATVLKSLRGVTVDDQPVKAAEATRLFLFHKPSGLLTSEHDPAGRPTIYAALRNALPESAGRVMPIGRLDYNTEGLLLLTNDGELKRAMELPSTGLPRTYRARTYGDVTQEQLESLIEGIEVEGMRYGRIDANMERKTGRNQWIELTIREGKNREIRNVLEYLNLEVSRLMRTSYGPFELLNLPRGAAVEIRQVDVEKFRRALLGGTVDETPPADQGQAKERIVRPTPRRDQAALPAAKRPAPRRDQATPRTDSRPSPRRDSAAPRTDDRPAPRRDSAGPRIDSRSAPRRDRGAPRTDDRSAPRRDHAASRTDERAAPRRDSAAPRTDNRSAPRRDRGAPRTDDRPAPRQDRAAPRSGDRSAPRRDHAAPRTDDRSAPRRSGPNKLGAKPGAKPYAKPGTSAPRGPRKPGPHNAGPRK